MIDTVDVNTWLVLAVLASPHVLYAYVWFFPHRWMSIFKKDSVEVFENIAWMLKLLQFSGVSIWYLQRKPEGIDYTAIDPLLAAIALALFVGGQALNIGIYKAIGHPGVYYGFKLGHSVSWVDGFPFNVVAHPQYVGSVMTVWAVVVMLWGQAPFDMPLLAMYWTVLYVLTGWQENCL